MPEVTDRRGTLNLAPISKDLVDVHFPDAERIRLVVDNLNTHTLAVLYDVFDALEARRIARRVEVHYTPEDACAKLGGSIPHDYCV